MLPTSYADSVTLTIRSHPFPASEVPRRTNFRTPGTRHGPKSLAFVKADTWTLQEREMVVSGKNRHIFFWYIKIMVGGGGEGAMEVDGEIFLTFTRSTGRKKDPLSDFGSPKQKKEDIFF